MAVDGGSGEKVSSVEWVIPENVSKELREGGRKVLDKIKEFNPDVVVALKRKGALTYSAVESTENQNLPPRVDVSIGRELSDPFLGEDREFDLLGEGGRQEYLAYLISESGKPESRVARAIADAKSAKPEGKINKVFVVDDSIFGGATMFTVPFIIKSAWGEDTEISTGIVFEHNNAWDGQIRDATFKIEELDSANQMAVKSLLTMLMKGEYDEGEFNLDKKGKITSWEDVEMLGRKIMENPIFGDAGDTNPADILKEKYTQKFLLGLNKSFIEALQREIVK